MKKILLFVSFIVAIIIVSCLPSYPTPAISSIKETGVVRSSSDDVIRLNNCGGTGESSQTIELDRSIQILSPTTTIQKVEAERLIDSKYSDNSSPRQQVQG
jgi:hypothetical protein